MSQNATLDSLQIQTPDSAQGTAAGILSQAQKGLGFVPNLYGTMANAPALLEAYTSISKIFAKTSFSPVEQQVVLLAVSGENGCDYCMAAHSTLAKGAGMPDDVLESLRVGRTIGDPKLEALRRFSLAMVQRRGWPEQAELDAFLAAGFAQEQVLEVVLGVGMKILSNYTNHVAATPLDAAFQPQAWSAPVGA